MKRKVLIVLIGILFLLGFSEILYAQTKTDYVNLTVYTGEEYSIYSSTWKYVSGIYPCVEYRITGNAKSWISITDSNKKKIDSICLSKEDPNVDINVYVSIPEDAEYSNYSATIEWYGTSWAPGFDPETEIEGISIIKIALTVINPKRIEAESKMTEAKDLIDKTKSEGIKIDDIENQFYTAKDLYNNKKFSEIIDLMSTIESNISNRKVQYNKVDINISRVKSLLESLKDNMFASIDNTVNLLNKAETLFDEGFYVEANDSALKAIKEIETETRIARERKDTVIKAAIIFTVIIGIILIVIMGIAGVMVIKRKSKKIKISSAQAEVHPKSDIQSTEAEKEGIIESDREGDKEKQKDLAFRRLAKQYADGKISKEDYERLRKILEET